MESYDVLMIVVIVGATIFGAWKGMAWQIASIASLVVSYFASLAFSPRLAPFLSNDAPWNRLMAMLVIYLITSMLIWMAFRYVSAAIDRVQLREFDKQIGALFGLAKGVLLCVAITMFAVSLLPPEQKERIIGSKSGHYIAKLLSEAHEVMPDEIHEVLHPYLHKAQETLDPNYVPDDAHRGVPHTATLEDDSFSTTLQPGLFRTASYVVPVLKNPDSQVVEFAPVALPEAVVIEPGRQVSVAEWKQEEGAKDASSGPAETEVANPVLVPPTVGQESIIPGPGLDTATGVIEHGFPQLPQASSEGSSRPLTTQEWLEENHPKTGLKRLQQAVTPEEIKQEWNRVWFGTDDGILQHPSAEVPGPIYED